MPINTKIHSESKPFALGSCGYIVVRARAKVDTDSGSTVHNFCALKVVKWARMLPAAASPVSVDPSKNGTKRSGSEEVHRSTFNIFC